MINRVAVCCLALFGASVLAASLAAAEDPARSPRWFKGNLHTHSLWSDGNDFPEMIVDWYVKHDYDFLGLSDHNILSRGEKWVSEDVGPKRGAIDGLRRYRARFGDDWVETRQVNGKTEIRLKTLDEFRPLFEKPGEFLLIQAEEITDHYKRLPIHVNATNIAELIRPQGGESIRETIANNLIAVERQSRQVGRPMLAHLNHPNFGYAVTAEDMAAVVQERFFEVYNGHPSVNHLGDDLHPGLERMWDIANTIRIAEMTQPPLLALATDDSHNYFGNRGSSPGRGWVMVQALDLSAEAIVRAIQQGDFYASSGVTLASIQFDKKLQTLSIEIDAEEGVEYEIQFIGTPVGYDNKSTPVVDKDGKEINATRRYSADVGRVFKKVKGGRADYQLNGTELYIRAVVTSSKPHWNPSFDNQREQAWTQPVGWYQHLREGNLERCRDVKTEKQGNEIRLPAESVVYLEPQKRR